MRLWLAGGMGILGVTHLALTWSGWSAWRCPAGWIGCQCPACGLTRGALDLLRTADLAAPLRWNCLFYLYAIGIPLLSGLWLAGQDHRVRRGHWLVILAVLGSYTLVRNLGLLP